MKILVDRIKIYIDSRDVIEYKGTRYTAKVPQSFSIERRTGIFKKDETVDYVVEHINSKMQMYSIKKYHPGNDLDCLKITMSKWKQLANKDKKIKDFLLSYWEVEKIKRDKNTGGDIH